MLPEDLMPAQQEKRWLTQVEARAYIGNVINKDRRPIAASTLASYVKKEILHIGKRGIGRKNLYDKQELDKLLKVQFQEGEENEAP